MIGALGPRATGDSGSRPGVTVEPHFDAAGGVKRRTLTPRIWRSDAVRACDVAAEENA
jgi:hypothetical protein